MEDEDGASYKFTLFASELDWRIGRWAIQEGIRHKSFDRLMLIPGASTGMSLNLASTIDNVHCYNQITNKLGLSYHNICGLHKVINSVPSHVKWKTRELWYKSDSDDKHTIHYRDSKEIISTLLGNSAHTKDIVYYLRKIFTDSSKTTRIYNKMWTSEWWNTVQVRLMIQITI